MKIVKASTAKPKFRPPPRDKYLRIELAIRFYEI